MRVPNSFARAEISELRSKSDLRGHITHWCGLKIDIRGSNIKYRWRELHGRNCIFDFLTSGFSSHGVCRDDPSHLA